MCNIYGTAPRMSHEINEPLQEGIYGFQGTTL